MSFISQVGILGNAADFYEEGPNNSTFDSGKKRRQMMIAFDMRYGVKICETLAVLFLLGKALASFISLQISYMKFILFGMYL